MLVPFYAWASNNWWAFQLLHILTSVLIVSFCVCIGRWRYWLIFSELRWNFETKTKQAAPKSAITKFLVNYRGLPWCFRQWRVCLQCGRPGFDLWVGKVPWRRKWQPIPIFLPGKSHGWSSLAGYSPWGHKGRTPLSDFTSLITYIPREKQVLTSRNQGGSVWAAGFLPVFISDKGKGRAVGRLPGLGAFPGKTQATSPGNKRAGGTADIGGSWQNGVSVVQLHSCWGCCCCCFALFCLSLANLSRMNPPAMQETWVRSLSW